MKAFLGKDQEPEQQRDILCRRLTAIGYVELFEGSDEELSSIWNQKQAPDRLAEIVRDDSAPSLARFIAAEILFDKLETFPQQEVREQVAELYALALADNYTETGNTWGLPGSFEGFTGEHVLSLTDAAVPALRPLLGNASRIYYEGSKEATLGNSCQYRVKDLAAFYLSVLNNIPLELDPDPVKRDTAIATLQAAME